MQSPFMTTNCYAPEGRVLLCGTCLPEREPAVFAALAAEADCVLTVCLEETHLNMVTAKLTAMLAAARISALTLATVDRSPHCVQLHYLRHEIERTLPDHVPIRHVIAAGGAAAEVSPEAVEMSKSLIRLQQLTEGADR